MNAPPIIIQIHYAKQMNNIRRNYGGLYRNYMEVYIWKEGFNVQIRDLLYARSTL